MNVLVSLKNTKYHLFLLTILASKISKRVESGKIDDQEAFIKLVEKYKNA